MLIKGALAQKIVKRTGLGHNPLHIREKIRHANIPKDVQHKIIKEYDRLLQGKPQTAQEVKQLLHVLGDKKVVDLQGTYLHTIAHNPEKVVSWAKHIVKAEDYERRQEQMHTEVEQLKKLELEKKEKGKASLRGPVHQINGGKMKDGKLPLPPQIKAA